MHLHIHPLISQYLLTWWDPSLRLCGFDRLLCRRIPAIRGPYTHHNSIPHQPQTLHRPRHAYPPVRQFCTTAGKTIEWLLRDTFVATCADFVMAMVDPSHPLYKLVGRRKRPRAPVVGSSTSL